MYAIRSAHSIRIFIQEDWNGEPQFLAKLCCLPGIILGNGREIHRLGVSIVNFLKRRKCKPGSAAAEFVEDQD